MKRIIPVLLLFFATFQINAQQMEGPLRVHPENGRYFTNNSGKAILLTGSHTWANFQESRTPDEALFDYEAYLKMLKEHNHNFIRQWTWEHAKNASWTKDEVVFSPLPYQTVNKNGKEFYDVSQWNEAYFKRLRTRIKEAGDMGIYVSVMLFQGWSQNRLETPGSDPWEYHPLNPVNNINGIGKSVKNNGFDEEKMGTLHAVNNGDVLKHQEAYVKKVIETVNDLDNVLYEIINEGGTKKWQYHMINLVKEIEKSMPKQHPVGMTPSVVVSPPMFNDDLWESPADWISPTPEPISWMYKGTNFIQDYKNDPPANTGKKVVILDTDHLGGHWGTYMWAWKSFVRGHNPIFMDSWVPLAGHYDRQKSPEIYYIGGVTKNDADHPDYEPLRKNMGHILALANRIDLANMTPQDQLSSTRFCLAKPGEEYVMYLPEGTGTLDLRNANVEFDVEWFFPVLNRTIKGTETLQGGSYRAIVAPFTGASVLYLKKK
ncbi:apiosidase-like domain-containing protein [Arcticibacterium luteifluviistationis]|uniref:Apiosidase-like catalytic domain-containing protein n=1 Tax=Arcticibacterium luteifluviistationis TaxID=1784714 RepID=A0A2Z4G8H7_9BACT|nr:DUF4038 domain-containing protein [Arcticibacterium luteifluviistationis]AWV97497.1 hypothetical protein DJ013_04675 [Arcticibacterium luteifluviistationis]